MFRRAHTGRIAVWSFVGGLAGFLGYVAVSIVTFIYYAEIVSNRDEMGGVGDAIPRAGVMVALVTLGAAAGALLGWRLSKRRQGDEPGT